MKKMNKIIYAWHNKLDMPKHEIDWHKQDIEDELKELEEARGFVPVWSELSDVAYTFTRAHWSGHNSLKLPISKPKYYIGLIYMFPKYQLRWNLFNKVGKKFAKEIKEVRNPKKIHKLHIIAERYSIDKDEFENEVKKKLKRKILLK